MDRYIKQIQTRVNRKLKIHDQSVTKQQIRDVYSQIVKNPVQPTTREMSQVTELLAKQFSPSEKIIELNLAEGIENPHITSAISSQNQSPATIEITPSDNPNLWETPPSNSITQTETEQTVELAITQTGESNNTQTNLPTHQPTVGISITQTEITQAIAMAVKQVGENGNTEAIQLLTSLAEELSSDISDTQEMVAALVSAYLDKRQSVLSSAIGTLNTLRLAQTSSFQSGLNNDFFAQKTRSKRQFLTQIETMFN